MHTSTHKTILRPGAFALLLTLSVMSCSVGVFPLHAEEVARDPKQNAALQYWQAFALLPQMDPNAKDICMEKVGERLTEATRAHLASRSSFITLRRGAAMPYCEWGLNEEDGPGLLMPHLSKARHLARFIAFGFQMNAEDGKPNEGVTDLAAGFAFSRHVASDSILISFLVHCAIDSILIDRSAFFLPQLDKAHLKELADALDHLPPTPKSADALRFEKRVFGGWMRKQLADNFDKPDARVALKALGMDTAALTALTREGFIAQLDELSRFYDELADLHSLPLPEFERKQPELEERIKKAGPVVRMCLPAVSKIRIREVASAARLQMYRAAIAVLLEGQEALKRFPDPYDGKPFTYRTAGQGFVLASNLKDNQNTVELRVGGTLGAATPQGDAPPKAPEF